MKAQIHEIRKRKQRIPEETIANSWKNINKKQTFSKINHKNGEINMFKGGKGDIKINATVHGYKVRI